MVLRIVFISNFVHDGAWEDNTMKNKDIVGLAVFIF